MLVGHSVNVHPDGASAVLIGGITQMDADTGTDIMSEETAGSPYAQNATVMSQKPRLTFTSRDLKKVIDTFGFIGLPIFGATNPGVELWTAFIENGMIKTGSFHKKIRIPTGRAVIRRISCNHQEDAAVECEMMAIWDGLNAPFIPSTANQALPGVPSDPGRYTLHSLNVGGVAITNLQNIDIDFGMSLMAMGGDSNIWDTQMLIEKLLPIITFRTGDATRFVTTGGVPLGGLVGTHANTTIKLRKRASGATAFVPDATAEHIVITTAGQLIVEKPFAGTQFKRGESSYRITTRFDGTNVPLVFNTASTLT
jgi:hypothetical protein